MGDQIPWYLTEPGLWCIGLALGGVGMNIRDVMAAWRRSRPYYMPGAGSRSRGAIAFHVGVDYGGQVVNGLMSGGWGHLGSEVLQDASLMALGMDAELYIRLIFFLYACYHNNPMNNNLFFAVTQVRRAFIIARRLFRMYWSSHSVTTVLSGETMRQSFGLARSRHDFFETWVRRARSGIPVLIAGMITGGSLATSLVMRQAITSSYGFGPWSGPAISMLLTQQMVIGIGGVSLGIAHFINSRGWNPQTLFYNAYRAVREPVAPVVARFIHAARQRIELLSPTTPFRVARNAAAAGYRRVGQGRAGRVAGTVGGVFNRIRRCIRRMAQWVAQRTAGMRGRARNRVNKIWRRAIATFKRAITGAMSRLMRIWMYIMVFLNTVYFNDFLGGIRRIRLIGRLLHFPLYHFGRLFVTYFPRVVRSTFRAFINWQSHIGGGQQRRRSASTLLTRGRRRSGSGRLR